MKFKNVVTGSIVVANSEFTIEQMKKSPTFKEVVEKSEISKKEKVEDKKNK